MTKVYALIVIFLFRCEGQRFSSGKISILKTSAEQELTIQTIDALIQKQKITTIDELLNKLPTEYLKYHTALYESISEQEASPENPRFIHFGETGELILAYHGNEKAKNYDTLEVIAFNKTSNQTEFYQIKQNNTEILKLKTEPNSCRTCHGAEGSYILSSYPFWPGHFGSSDDLLDGEELENFVTFKRTSIPKKRYAAINKIYADRSTTFPFYGNQQSSRKFVNMPNSMLTLLTSRLTAQKLAAHLFSSAKFAKEKNLLILTTALTYLSDAQTDPCLKKIDSRENLQKNNYFLHRISRLAEIRFSEFAILQPRFFGFDSTIPLSSERKINIKSLLKSHTPVLDWTISAENKNIGFMSFPFNDGLTFFVNSLRYEILSADVVAKKDLDETIVALATGLLARFKKDHLFRFSENLYSGFSNPDVLARFAKDGTGVRLAEIFPEGTQKLTEVCNLLTR